MYTFSKYTCTIVHLKVEHCQTLHIVIYRSKWVNRFWLVKALSCIVEGGQNDSKKTGKNARVHIWVNSQNGQLTDFDHYSYLPLKFGYSRMVKT